MEDVVMGEFEPLLQLTHEGQRIFRELESAANWTLPPLPAVLNVLVSEYASRHSVKDEHDMSLVIGLLASNIRGDWRDPGSRIEHINQLCLELDHMDWWKQLNSTHAMYNDGRWFRDKWNGPYGGDWLELHDLKYLERVFDDLTHPEYT